jgi:Ni/Fe-hydrogenase subunit HybB-like protein
MKRLTVTKSILTFIAGFGLSAILLRFITALGGATNLTDAMPWGLWKGLNVMAGVALASSGFVIAGIIHIFNLKEYKPLLRPTVLIAFLGYSSVPLSLIIDIGQSWNIWRPIFFWQHHSVLFEVSMCVMLYLIVLTLEFAPAILEHPLFNQPLLQKVYTFLKRSTVLLVVLGITLSTLHQSSLGSLFLIVPFRAHELWYSPVIYLLYFVSAIGLGCSMIIFGSIVPSFLYQYKPPKELLRKLGSASSIVLIFYTLIRLVDIGMRGKFTIIFNNSWQSNLFIFEMLISAIIPVFLFNTKRVKNSITGLLTTSSLVVAGFILNRMNISIITISQNGPRYIPSVIEFAVSFGLVAIAILVFMFFIEHLNLFQGKFLYIPKPPEKVTLPSMSGFAGPVKTVNSTSLRSFLFIISIALGFSMLYGTALQGKKYRLSPAQKAIATADTTILQIDNGDTSIYVNFNHIFHQDTLGKKESCIKCHHMSITDDEVTPCYLCHKDMYQAIKIFDHINHQNLFETEGNCKKCHLRERTLHTFTPCKTCHTSMLPTNFTTVIPNRFQSPAYMDAMHTACINCHLVEWKKVGRPTPDYCNSCHKDMEGDIWREKDFKVNVVSDTSTLIETDSLGTSDSLSSAP